MRNCLIVHALYEPLIFSYHASECSLLHASCALQKSLQVLLPQCLRDHVCTPLRQIHVEWKPACYQLGARSRGPWHASYLQRSSVLKPTAWKTRFRHSQECEHLAQKIINVHLNETRPAYTRSKKKRVISAQSLSASGTMYVPHA